MPFLAKSYKQIDDKTYEYELRDDIVWHDGEKFGADDVVFTLNRLVDKSYTFRFKEKFNFIAQAEKLGPFKVRVTNVQPTSGDFPVLAFNTGILPAHLTKKFPNYDDSVWQPVGTGMFKALQVDRNKGIIFERNPAYKHGGTLKPASTIGRWHLMPIPDKGTQLAQFMVGNVDAVRDLDLDQAADMAKRPGSAPMIHQATRYMCLALDAKGRAGNKALQDPRVRRAVLMAVDSPEILKITIGEHKVRRIPDQLCYKFQAGCDCTLPPPKYDPDGAKKLLAEAGYPNGFEIEITTFNYRLLKNVTELMTSQLGRVGIKATIDSREVNAYRSKQRDGKIQAMVGSWPAGSNPDVSATLNFLYAPTETTDYHGDREMIGNAIKLADMVNGPERQAIGRKVFDRATEQSYFLPLSPYPIILVHSADLKIEGDDFSAFGIEVDGINWKK